MAILFVIGRLFWHFSNIIDDFTEKIIKREIEEKLKELDSKKSDITKLLERINESCRIQ